LAKVHYKMRNYSAAEKNLSIVLQCHQHKDSFETLKILAQIKARQSIEVGSFQIEALKLFRRVLELNPKDFDANFELASLFERSDPAQALIYYENGIKIIRDEIASPKKSKFQAQWPSSFTDASAHIELTQTMVPPELLNNYAVLLMDAKKHADAKKILEEALANCETL
jgi:tetratricopeptide (TPR) repeat protein